MPSMMEQLQEKHDLDRFRPLETFGCLVRAVSSSRQFMTYATTTWGLVRGEESGVTLKSSMRLKVALANHRDNSLSSTLA